MPHVHFSGPKAEALIAATGATIAAFGLRGWTCTVDAEGMTEGALRVLGADIGTPQGAELIVLPDGATPAAAPSLRWGGPAPLVLRVHEGLDAKVAALGAQRGAPLGEGEARSVILAALTLGQGTGAEGFAPDAGAEDRLRALLGADR